MEFILILVAIAILVFVLGRKKNQPKPNDTFTCAECGKVSKHNYRTLRALRRGSDKFYCDICFRRWWLNRVRERRNRLIRFILILIILALVVLVFYTIITNFQ